MNGEPPYLSVVVVARNDDHGGGLRGRMQAFVNGCIAQCERHKIPAELLVVEWNPPADRPPLADALCWPTGRYCAVRIIEVPPEVHARYRHAAALPLYQMIGKNAGIRRARGQFVLATNIDILFSDELMQFLALRQLDPGRMYRIDRYDAMAGVPEDGIDDQLEYCRTRLIRVNAREGTFKLTAGGKRAIGERDVAPPDGSILFGEGWFPVEGARDQPFRWAGPSAELLLSGSGAVALEVEPGPNLHSYPLALQITNAGGVEIGRVTIHGRSRLTIPAPDPQSFRSIVLKTLNASSALARDPRILNFRALRCEWEKDGALLAGPCVSRSEGRSFAPEILRRWWMAVRRRTYTAPLFLHTNACGDFTLMARERWLALRGYPEFDAYSMHLDSVLCYAAHHSGTRELVLGEPMRIFHIEHGSGWTPENEAQLFSRLKAKGIPFTGYADMVRWASRMRRRQSPLIFNPEDWGLANLDLREVDR